MGRPLMPCGTKAAYERHRRAKEPIDDACRKAHNTFQREYRADDTYTERHTRELARYRAKRDLANLYPELFRKLCEQYTREIRREKAANGWQAPARRKYKSRSERVSLHEGVGSPSAEAFSGSEQLAFDPSHRSGGEDPQATVAS